MRNTRCFILLLSIILGTTRSFSQEIRQERDLEKILYYVVIAPDSIRKHFQNTYDAFNVEYRDSVDFKISCLYRQVCLYFPRVVDIEKGEIICSKLDSLSTTSDYWNKVVANKMYKRVLSDMIELEDTLVTRKQSTTQVRLLINRIVLADLDKCARYTDVNIVSSLKRSHYTPAVVERLAAIMLNPRHNYDEAKVIAQRKVDLNYLQIDTAGLFNKVKDFKDLSQREIDKVKYTYKLLQDAEKVGLPFTCYIDTLRQRQIATIIGGNLEEDVTWIGSIVDEAGLNYVLDLAPAIEEYYISGKERKVNVDNCWINLARLQYNDYENTVLRQIKRELDSTSILLSKPLDKNHTFDVISDLFSCYRSLAYINTQESYYNAAPLLLRKEMRKKYSDDSDEEFMIGARFFLELNSNIENYPWDIDEYKDEYVNDEFIEKKMPKDFLDKMYKWMIENKGNYKIKQY